MATDFNFNPNKEVVAKKAAEEQAVADAASNKPKDLVAEILAAPPVDEKREQEIGTKHFRRILHGVNGSDDAKKPLTPDEAAIKDAYEKELKANYAAELERVEKVKGTVIPEALTDRQKTNLARHLNIQITQNRALWRQLNDTEIATMLAYRRSNREDWRQIYDEYNPNGSGWSQAGHGLKSFGKSLKIPLIGRSTSQLMSTSDNLDELSKTDQRRLDNNAAVQAEFWRVLKKFKADPKSRRKDTVDALLTEIENNKELMSQANWAKHPEFKAKMDTLNDVEMADLMLALNHARYPMNGKGEKETERPWYNPYSADRKVRLDDFNLDAVDGEWDPKQSEWLAEPIGLAYAAAFGGAPVDDPKENQKDRVERHKKYELRMNPDGSYVKDERGRTVNYAIDPLLFATDNIGRGAFGQGQSDNNFFSKWYAAQTYNRSSLALWEGALTGAVTLGMGIGGNAIDPTEEFGWNIFTEGEVGAIKNFLHGNGSGTVTDMPKLVAMWKAAQQTQDNIEGYMNGEKSLIAGPALAMLSSMSLDEAQKSLRKYGALNQEAINTGVFRYNPSAIAGRSAVIGGVGMAGGMGVIGGLTKGTNILAANKIITLRRAVSINGKLTKLGNGIAAVEAFSFGLPAKVVGTVVGGTGRATLYAVGKAGEAIANGLNKLGMNMTPNKALGMIGVSSAFTNFTIGQKMLGLYGFGVAANDVGFFLKRFGYTGVNANGYGFARVMQEVGENWSKGPVAGSLFEGATNLTAFGARLAKAAGKHTWFTIPMHDFVKGSWHGAGVGYGLGFLQDGHRAGVAGLWGGVGMGGLGGVHGSWSQWRGGLYAHAQTKAELFKLVEHDPVQLELVQEQVKNAEIRQDWNAIPLMLGAAKYAGEHGFRVTLHRNSDIQHIDERLLDLDNLTDADLTINGKKHELVAERDTLNALSKAELDIRRRLAQDDAEPDPAKKLSDTQRAQLLQDAMTASQAAEGKLVEYRKAIKDWLTDLKVNGDEATRAKVAHLSNYHEGVFIGGKAGEGVIFVNVDRASNTATAHELFHGVQRAVAIHSAKAHFVNQVFGISSETIVETDAAGNLISKGILTAQKGGANIEILKDFANLYIDVLHARAGEATRDRHKAKVLDAIDALGRKDLNLDAMAAAEGTLRYYAEEFGAYYFESYLSRNKADLLYNRGKYVAFERILNQVENYIDHNTKLDLNGQGIHENILRIRNERDSKNQRELVRKLDNVHKKLSEQIKKLEDLAVKEPNGDIKRDANGEVVWKTGKKARALTIQEGIGLLHKQRLDLQSAAKKNRIGSTFVNKDGTHLILPQAEEAMRRIVEGKPKSLSTNPFDLTSLPKKELESILTRAGLEHWVDQDGNLKPREVIEKEAAERGKSSLDLIEQLGPKVTGIVVHRDKDGNARGIGVLTDEGIKALRDKLLITDSELLKITTIRNVIRGVIGMDPLGGGEMNFLYNGLSGEFYAGDGSVGRNRKPKNEVAPTYRRVLPYKMEMVMTTKDRDGNKIPPRFEFMMTGIDMGVVLDRAAYEFGQSYQIGDTGTTISVSDTFGGNFALFKQAINMYLTGLAEGRMPSADLFGGGERGQAIRDVMLRVIGPSPERSFRSDGTPMFENNPIIKPFNTWDRGPNFAFTTFRIDLMQDIEMLHSPIRFNEQTGYNNLTKNFSPVKYTAPQPVRGRISFTATAEYEWINRRKENIVGTRTANYTVSQTKDGKFQVGSEDFKKPIVVSSEKAARDFIELDVQRREYIGKNIIAAHLHGGESGVLAVSHNGKYMLVDTKNKNRPIEGRIFDNEVEAVSEAAKIHNSNLLSQLRGKTGERERRLAESLIEQAIAANSSNPEMIPQRLAIGKGGLPKLSVVRDSEGKEVKYTVNDEEVKRGLAVPNQTKKVVQFQKVGYGLMESMLGNSNLRMMDPSVHGAAERVAEELVNEAREAAKDPAKRKGIDWYRRMVRDGYSVFGSIYGMFSELEGATSARTPVAENFKQAMEALTMFSRNAYNKQLAEVDAAIKDIEARAAVKDDVTGRSQFEAEAVDILQKKAAAKEANEKFDEDLDWFEWEDPKSVGREIDAEALAGFREAYLNIRNTSKKTTLTPSQLSDALQGAKSKVFKQAGALMLRANGKKYNANTVKVGQVMYGLWRELTEGPKTPNFAGNLSGLVRSATVDVWAARSLHRIINSKINGRKKWRLSAGMETGVDYVWYPQGDNFNPNWEGGGDFFFGQKVFELAAERLRQEGGDFTDMMPDDLQALIWFHEKGIWAENGWTDNAGAEFSSFEGPTERVSGTRDSSGVNEWNNIRRFLVGVSGSYWSGGIDIPVAGKIVAQSAVARQFAAPQGRVLELKGAVADALKPIGQNSGQSYGYYGDYLEHSLFFDILVQRGKTQDLAQEAAKGDSELVKAQNKLDGLRAKMRDPNTPSTERGKIDKAIRKAEAALATAKSGRAEKNSAYQQEVSNPSMLNQMSLLLEHMIGVAKNYNQSDVMVGEVVGENHPNARPAMEVLFAKDKPVDLATALEIADRLKGAGKDWVTGFTLIPDPRNGANPRLTEITKRLAEVTEKRGVPVKGKEAEFQKLTNEVNSLTKFIGVRSEANPEMTARFATDNPIAEIKTGKRNLLSEADARWYMENWRQAVKDASLSITEHNGIRLQPREYFVSTETVPKGAYDSFNPAEIGREVSLADRLHRYRVGLEREAALADEFVKTGDLFPSESAVLKDNRTTWAATPADREAGSRIDPSLDAYEQGKTASRVSGNIVLTPDAADAWVKKAFVAPMTKSDGGVIWGNKDYTVTQRRAADGTLTNTYEIRGAYDRRPTIVTGLENAKMAVKQRLTGDQGAAAGERSIEVNGEKFTINEATMLGITEAGESNNPNAGRYDKESNIFKYKPDDSPTVQKFKYNSVPFKDAFDLPNNGVITTFYSDRMEKVHARLNATLARLGVNQRWKVQVKINTNYHENQDYSASEGRTTISFTTQGNNFPIRIGHQSFNVTKVNPVAGAFTASRRPMASQPTHASGDQGSIGSANVLNGSMTPWYNSLQTLKKVGLWTNISEELQIRIDEKVANNEPYSFTNLLTDVLGDIRTDVEIQKITFDKDTDPMDVRRAINAFEVAMYGTNIVSIFETKLGAKLNAKAVEDIITQFQNIGYALNAELGGRLYATGMLPKGTSGLDSQVVNTEGAVIKTRVKTWGEDQHQFAMDTGKVTKDPKEALRINTENDVGLNMISWTPTDPTHKFSPVDDASGSKKPKQKFLSIDRAFTDADNQNTIVKGGFFSKRAEDIFGESIKDFEFSFGPSGVWGGGSRSIQVVLAHKGNEVMSFNIFPLMTTDYSNPNREGNMLGKAEIKAVWENTEYTRDSKNGLGDMQKLYAGVFTEVVERLRQTGQKFISVNEDSLPNNIKDDVKTAISAVFGHGPQGKVSNLHSNRDGAKELIGDMIQGLQGKNSGPNDAWFLKQGKAYKPEDHQSFKDWEDNWVQKGGGSFQDIFAAWKHFETKGGMYSVYDPNYERKVGTKSISLEDLMTIVNHKGIKWEDATPQEQLMYDLLGLLDSFSGLRKESGARVIMDEPHQRSHSSGAAESQMRVDVNYYFKTTGDLTTLIEEIHHSLFGSEREGMIRDDYNELGIGDGYPTLNERVVTPNGMRVITAGRSSREIPAVPSSEWIAKMRDANKKNLDDTIARNLDPKVAMRRAAFYTLIESWLRVFENPPAEMIKSMATTRVGKAAMKANPDITAAELALGTQPVATQKQKIVGSGRNKHYQKFQERDAANKLRIGSPRDRSFGDPAKSAYSDDYHLPTLVEFAAGVLNDSKIQALLARLPKIDGDAIDTVLDHYEKSQNAEYKGWAGKVRSAWSSAQTMFNQVLAAIRTLAWYNSGYIRDVEEARSKVDPLAKAADDLRSNQKKDTLLDSAIRAAIMINPRSAGPDTMRESIGYNGDKTYTRQGIKDPRTTRIDSDTSLILANAASNVKLRADYAASKPQAEAAEAATAKGVSGRVSFVKGLSDQIKNPPAKTGAYVVQKTALSNSNRTVWDANAPTPQTVRFVNPSSVLVNEILAAQSHKQDGGYSLTSHLRGRDITKKGTTIESLYPDLDSILPDFDPDKPYQNMRGDQEKIVIKQTVNLIKAGNNEVANLYESIRESLRTGTKNNDIVPIPFEFSDSGNGWYDVSISGYKNAFNSSPAERAIASQKLRAILLAFHFHNLSVSASERVPLPILMENKSNSRWSKTTGFEFTQGDTTFRE